MPKPTLIEQVETLARSRDWSCLSPVVNGAGEWALLQWRCAAGHTWSSSLRTAERAGCPACKEEAEEAIMARFPKATSAPAWRDVTPSPQQPLQTQNPVPTPARSAQSKPQFPRRKISRIRSRPRFSGVIA